MTCPTGGASGPIRGDPGRRLLRIGVQRRLNADTGPLPISQTRILHQPVRSTAHEYRSVSPLLPYRHEGSWLGDSNYSLLCGQVRGRVKESVARGYAAGFLRGLPRRGASGSPEVDGVGGTADLQFLPQRFGRRVESAPDRQGRFALSELQLLRLSEGYALDGPNVFFRLRSPRVLRVMEACQTWAFHYLCARAAANEAFGPPLAQPSPMIGTRTARSGWRRRLSLGRPRRPPERLTI